MIAARMAAGWLVVLACGLWCATAGAQGNRNVSGGDPSPVDGGETKMLAAGAVASDILSVNPFAFEGLEAADIAGSRAAGAARYCDPSIGFPCLFEAPVELPERTVVTRLELDAVGSDTSFVKANFYRCPAAAEGCDLLAEASTTGNSGATQIGTDLTVPETIDNTSYTYLLEVFPGDDGLTRLVGARLVFTGAESSASADVLALHPFAFEGRASGDRAALRATGIQRFCVGSSCRVAAPVELQSGSTVTRIELDAVDNGSAAVEADFSRCHAATGSCTTVASVGSSGTPGSTQPGFDLVLPETIDNANFTYRIEIALGATNETRLVGFRLFYDRAAAPAKNDRLGFNPCAFEATAAADSAVLDAVDDERFCNGQACTMLAPVDVPSGTRVSRLELAAWDNSSAEVRAAFLRCPEGSGNCVEAVSVATDGNPGNAEVGVDLPSPEIIDNASFSYAIEISSGPNADTALRGVSLTIERALIFSDGFGTGGTAPWSSTAQ